MSKVKVIGESVWYWCPGCERNHRIETSRWGYNGSEDQPTFSPSILVNPGQETPYFPICHHFVRDGKIEFLNDSTHKLAGKTVEMEDYHNGRNRD